MKKIISLVIGLLLISISLITVSADEPADPTDKIHNSFREIYSAFEKDYYKSFINSNYLQSDPDNSYYYINYTSNYPIEKPYFNRFGSNNEYYEYCEHTNMMFESGITVFCGKITFDNILYDAENYYTLEEIAVKQPKVIEAIMNYNLGPTKRVGYIGDADCDGEVTVLDATTIQRHLAQIDVLKVELANDIDDNGYVDVMDATKIQRHIAELE